MQPIIEEFKYNRDYKWRTRCPTCKLIVSNYKPHKTHIDLGDDSHVIFNCKCENILKQYI